MRDDTNIRLDQQRWAAGTDRPIFTNRAKKAFVPKGHDAQLYEAQQQGLVVIVSLMTDIRITGKIVRRDKWTITVQGKDDPSPTMIYKHAIATIVVTQQLTSE